MIYSNLVSKPYLGHSSGVLLVSTVSSDWDPMAQRDSDLPSLLGSMASSDNMDTNSKTTRVRLSVSIPEEDPTSILNVWERSGSQRWRVNSDLFDCRSIYRDILIGLLFSIILLLLDKL